MTIMNLSSSDESLGRDGGGLKDDGSLSFSLTLSTTEESLGREVSSAMVEEVSSDPESKDKGHVKIDFANEGNRLDLPLIPAYEWAPHEPRNYKTSNERDLLLTVPFNDWQMVVLREINCALTQIHPNAWASMQAFNVLCRVIGLTPTMPIFLYFYKCPPTLTKGWISFIGALKSLVDLFLTLYKGFKTDFFKVSITRRGRKWFFDEVDRPKFPLYWTQLPPTIDPYFEKLMTPAERADLVILKQLPDKLSTSAKTMEKVKAHWKFVRSSSMPPRPPIRPPPLINEPLLEPDALTAKKDLAIAREEVKEIKVSVADLSKWFNQLNLIKSEHAKSSSMPPRPPIRPPPLINEPLLEPDALTAKKDLAIAREEVKEIKVSVADLSKWFNQLNLIKSAHAKCATKLKEGTERLKEATNQLKEVTNQLKEEQDRGRNAVDDIRKLQQRFDDLSLEYLSMKQSIETWEKKCQELEFELLIVDDQFDVVDGKLLNVYDAPNLEPTESNVLASPDPVLKNVDP
ncbi:hypothetical protein DEO72_LG1g2634 [Vigna unguiculata]|uniref:Transposase (putative) gypsy type domain-containing protein n=1 Tax=Vigna unguiculata TaxID=3917 RepID=A0A4D6KT95_VIGUN|nr:hypothetical protein DEO72_LG1g2634 [Vigna unguiculata]